MVPMIVGWLVMWLSSCVIVTALRQKERVRDALLAAGAVWTAHDAFARRLHFDRDSTQRHLENMSGACGRAWGRAAGVVTLCACGRGYCTSIACGRGVRGDSYCVCTRSGLCLCPLRYAGMGPPAERAAP